MKAKLGRWYKVTDNLGTPSHYMLILVDKETKLGYLKTPISPYYKVSTGYEDSDWHFGWLSSAKLMSSDFRPKDTISESVARKAIKVIWS